MAKVIALMHLKGGVGKSTIAVNLAHSFKEYTKTALIDLDSQGSVTDTKDLITGVSIVEYSNNNLRGLDYGAVFIDTPPYLSDKLYHIFPQTDLIIIPTKAGIYDVIAAGKTVEMIKEQMKKNKNLKAVFLLNMVNATSSLTDVAKEKILHYGFPVLKSHIVDRQNFIRSAALNNGIFSTDDKKAVAEINALAKEVLFLLQ
jgi:chromosome partitioning protein